MRISKEMNLLRMIDQESELRYHWSHITHLSPQGPSWKAPINPMCLWDSQISLYEYFNEYKGRLTPLKSPIVSFFSLLPSCHPLWMACHPSVTHGTPSEAQINSTCPWDSQISLCGCLDEYKEEMTPLKSPISSFFQSSYPITLFG